MVKVFFSYSHEDEAFRNGLETHLSNLKRQGIIDTWHDRRIGAGEEIDQQISEHLETADIILLLVSPYFLASDYCYEVEMKRAMERHAKAEARVIPVILHPCDWRATPFGKLMATPTEGKPISKFPNQHDAFLEVTKAVRQAAQDLGITPSAVHIRESEALIAETNRLITPEVRSSNLRIKRSFTDREKDLFLSKAFEYMANFFEGSLSELAKRNPEVDTDFRRLDANRFSAAVYVHGSEANRCRIWLGGRDSFPGGIAYSAGDSVGDSSYNEALSVDDDGYALFLKPLGFGLHMRDKDEKMTLEGGAEYLWEIFIEPLQR